MICPPVWLCRCGCGGVTNIITSSCASRGLVKGEYQKYIKGHYSGKGRVCSPETRLRMSKAQKGKRGMRREANPNWKGGLGNKARNQSGRWSPDHTDWRKAIFERDDYACQFCEQRGGTLNAHHIKPWALYPELRFETHNGVTLCEDCHKQYYGVRRVSRG